LKAAANKETGIRLQDSGIKFHNRICHIFYLFLCQFGEQRFKDIGEIKQDFFELDLGGKKVVVMHQPKFIDLLQKDKNYDVVVYGHTHKIDIRKDASLVINPGETGGWLTGRSTVAILDTKNLTPEIIDLP